MKSITSTIMLAILFFGCDYGHNSANGHLTVTMQLTDTTGRQAASFHRGEEFEVSFTLTNTTKSKLRYGRANSGPDVIFHILTADSVIASSVDGYAFLPVAATDYLNPGDTMHGYWRGPTTAAQYPKVLLSLGSYELKVLFPIFKQVEINDVPAIPFSIVE
jgi:hypothetical protein